MAGISSSLAVSLLVAGVAALGYTNYQVGELKVDTAPAIMLADTSATRPATSAKDLLIELKPASRSIGEFPETTARPIFFSGRRVPEAPKAKPVMIEAKAVAVPIPVVLPGPLRLVGIAGLGANKSILVRSAQDPQGVWMSVGDEYRGWLLREINGEKAVVEALGEQRELRLYMANTKTASR